MKRAVAALFCLTLQVRAWGFSTTMPTDAPVTIIVDKPTRGSGGDDGSPREPREPREYSSPSASSADPAEALETLAMIVAAPVIVVGGAVYLAGKALKDWLEERRLARERAERDAKALADIRLADVPKPRGDKKPLLAEIVNSKDQPKKFESETKRYLENVDKWIEAAKPRPKPEEKKP